MVQGAVVLIGAYTFIPPLVGSLFGESIKNEMGLQTTPDVTLKSDPPPTMLAGNFAGGRISLGETEFGGIRPRRVTIDLDPFDLDLLKSVREGEFTSEKPLSGKLRVEISEKEVSRILGPVLEEVSIENVDLEQGRTTVRSGARLLGVDVPVAVRGGLEIQDQALVFEPSQVSAFGVRIPDRLSNQVLSQSELSYPLEDLPYETVISEVEVEKDHLILFGRLERIPLDDPGG